METLVRDLPEDQKRTAMANIASRTVSYEGAPRARQKPAEGGGSIAPGSYDRNRPPARTFPTSLSSSLEKITENELEGDIWLFVDWAVDSENGKALKVNVTGLE